MTRRVCCVCQIKLGEIDDGRTEVVDSHGYCQRHFDEAMTAMQNEFSTPPVDLARLGAA